MLKRDITYETFDDPPQTVTEPFYFNLTRTELIKLDSTYEGGVTAVFQRVIEKNNREEGVKEFDKFILAAYGVKSDDGKRFLKSQELRDEFQASAAYDVLFVELATNEKAQADFIMGVMPKEFTENLKDELTSVRAIQVPPLSPPPPPQA